MPSRWDRTAGLRRSVGILLGILLAVGAGFMLRSFEVATLEDQVDSWTAAANRAATELEQNDVTLADQTSASTALQLELQSKDERLIELEDVAVEYTLLQSTYSALQTATIAVQTTQSELETAFVTLSIDYQTLLAKWDNLQPIFSSDAQGEPLRVDISSGASPRELVCTGSMEPAIGCDDVVIHFPVDTADISTGDVIRFRQLKSDCKTTVPGWFFVHRVTGTFLRDGELHFWTKGDANPIGDPCAVAARHVVSKVIAVIYDAEISIASPTVAPVPAPAAGAQAGAAEAGN